MKKVKKSADRTPAKNGRGGSRPRAGRKPIDPSGAGVDVSLWLPKPMAKWLTAEAKKAGISRSEFAKRLLKRAMKQDKRKGK